VQVVRCVAIITRVPTTFAQDVASTGWRTAAGEIEFDLRRADPALFDQIRRVAPIDDAMAGLHAGIPLPPSSLPGEHGRFYRMANHTRSFCCALAAEVASPRALFASPVAVIKGVEPLLDDFERLAEWMRRAPFRQASRRLADHFAIAEGKVPGALTLAEARREVAIALEIQRRHVRHYGALARLPAPLLVHRLGAADVERCVAVLQRHLSPTAIDRAGPLAAAGLAVYVYFYPTAPVRSTYWGAPISRPLREHIQASLDVEAAVRGWVALFVRLLYLGFLPYSLLNTGLGACFDPGNAVMDGGFCDPDSIIPIEQLPDDEFVLESFVRCMTILRDTVQQHVATSDVASFACQRYLDQRVAEALASEARPGLVIDPRIARLLAPSSYAELRAATAARPPVGARRA